jgi:hypothetical protein
LSRSDSEEKGYPEWYTKDKIWKTLDLRDTEAVNGSRWLQVFCEDEWAATKDAVPVLQIPAHRVKPLLRVPLPEGALTLVLRDHLETVCGEMPLRVKKDADSSDH